MTVKCKGSPWCDMVHAADCPEWLEWVAQREAAFAKKEGSE